MVELFVFVAWDLFIFTIGFVIGGLVALDNLRNQAIEHGFAEYHPTTGAWQWKEAGNHE